jgi:copper chaperone CopZ
MKKMIIAMLMAGFIATASAQMTKIELQAAGVTCSMCSKAINKSLMTLPYISTINTNLEKNMFEIVLKDSMTANLDEVKKKVEAAGFSVGNLWLTVTLNSADVKNDAHIEAVGMNLHFMNVKAQQLNGAVRLKVIDKGFTSAKEYKKNSLFTKMACFKTGYMGDCCGKAPVTPTRIFHVTIA